MGCSAKWKREVVPDHKFDFINVQEYRSTALSMRLKYALLWLSILLTLGVHGANVYTAITYLLASGWTNTIYAKCAEANDCAVHISFTLCKWIFVGCILFSFLLLFYETWKCRRVLRSRDISYGFTNLYAHKWYSMRSYAHFCFFEHISASTKRADDFAFFVFFTFKSWKEVLIADAPRQVVNGLTLYSFGRVFNWQTTDLAAYWDGNWVTLCLLLAMIYTVALFVAGFLRLAAAAVFYLPLLCHIKGNLKEYVCHKVDKRIAELMVRKRQQRVARNAAFEKRLAAQGGKDSKGFAHQMPTLPRVTMDEADEVGVEDGGYAEDRGGGQGGASGGRWTRGRRVGEEGEEGEGEEEGTAGLRVGAAPIAGQSTLAYEPYPSHPLAGHQGGRLRGPGRAPSGYSDDGSLHPGGGYPPLHHHQHQPPPPPPPPAAAAPPFGAPDLPPPTASSSGGGGGGHPALYAPAYPPAQSTAGPSLHSHQPAYPPPSASYLRRLPSSADLHDPAASTSYLPAAVESTSSGRPYAPRRSPSDTAFYPPSSSSSSCSSASNLPSYAPSYPNPTHQHPSYPPSAATPAYGSTTALLPPSSSAASAYDFGSSSSLSSSASGGGGGGGWDHPPPPPPPGPGAGVDGWLLPARSTPSRPLEGEKAAAGWN